MIWSEAAFDYSSGIDILDLVNGKIYTEEQARAAPPEVRARLVNSVRKTGCFVMTSEEAAKALWNKDKFEVE